MEIRAYRPSDQSACLEVFDSNGTDFFTHQEADLFKRWLNRAYEMEDNYYYVIEEDGEILGCGGFYVNLVDKQATLAWGMVKKEFHKKGLGEQLLRYRIEKIISLMPEGKIITLDTTQQTFEFFEKLGFEVTNVRKGYYRKDLDRYDMELKIENLSMQE
jgi:ribosomal protein S18 acetylase RimI-like enzyme